MSPLTLTPFPSTRSDDQSQSRLKENEGFVDESVVLAVMLVQSAPFRRQSNASDLALAKDDLDFAGWHSPRQTLAPLPVLLEKAPAPESIKVKPIASEPPPRPQISRGKAPTPIKSRSWLPICAGILTLVLTTVLVATLLASRHLSFQSIVKNIFQLPTAAEKFEKVTATQASQDTRND